MGSKERLLGFIGQKIFSVVSENDVRFGDLFCGTAAVSKLFKCNGKQVMANDNLRCCYTFARSVLAVNKEPSFTLLLDFVGDMSAGVKSLLDSPYTKVLGYLNSLPGQDGFIYREYSPGGTQRAEHERLYFTDANARRIDSIRSTVFDWFGKGLIDETEACLLLADLMRAVNKVANTSGTYGCFNKTWDRRAHRPLELLPTLITESALPNEVYCEDATTVARRSTFDVLYLDPPYNWRHYGAYYHILETLASGDEPRVAGRTGLRAWDDSRSPFSVRTEAAGALRELMVVAKAKHIFLSYSSEGLIPHHEILDICRDRGVTDFWEVGHRRFKSNGGGSNEKAVRERLYHVKGD